MYHLATRNRLTTLGVMIFAGIFRTKSNITDDELRRGLRAVSAEGFASLSMASVVTSGILTAYALALGANNFQIGVLAAIPFLLNPLQIPVVLLVERLRRRKVVAFAAWAPATLMWIPIALIPFFLKTPGAPAVAALLVLMCARYALVAAATCAWHSWLRDFVPQAIMGSFYSRLMARASVASIVFGLAGAYFIQWRQERSAPEDAAIAYSFVLLAGFILFAAASPLFMLRVPEPTLDSPEGSTPGLRPLLRRPLQDANYRRLLTFLFLWGLAINLAVPFFTIYMLNRLGFPLVAVIALNTLAQVAHMLFIGAWGALADKFGSKAVLSASASLYALVILGWTFTTMPGVHALTMPLVVVLQIFAGVALAGVTLTAGTIGLKLSPPGEATPFLAMASLASSFGAGIGPLIGGRLIDYFSVRGLTLTFGWTDPDSTLNLSAVNITGEDFLFVIAFLLGLFTVRLLAAVKEEGSAERDAVLEELISPTRELTRSLGSMPGARVLTTFPYASMRRMPGLDVAIGVTAYQLAATMRAAALGAATGRATASGVSTLVGGALGDVVGQSARLRDVGGEVARHAVRGAMLAADASVDVGALARGAVTGAVRTLKGTPPLEAIRGAVRGALEGAEEAGVGAASAVQSAVEAAVAIATELAVPREQAEREARDAAEQTERHIAVWW